MQEVPGPNHLIEVFHLSTLPGIVEFFRLTITVQFVVSRLIIEVANQCLFNCVHISERHLEVPRGKLVVIVTSRYIMKE